MVNPKAKLENGKVMLNHRNAIVAQDIVFCGPRYVFSP